MSTEVRFERRMLINGKLVEGRAGEFANINPATEEVLGEVSDASREDMAAAIDAARESFDSTENAGHTVLPTCVGRSDRPPSHVGAAWPPRSDTLCGGTFLGAYAPEANSETSDATKD